MIARAGILSGIAAPIVSWGLSLVVIASWPGYDPVRQSISLLVTGPLGWLETLAFVATGLLGIGWANGLPAALGSSARDRALVRGVLLAQAAIVLAFAAFPTDREDVPVSTLGALHLLDFALYAVVVPLTLVVLSRVMRRDPRWTTAAGPTLVAAALSIAGLALVPVTLYGPLLPWLGLLERLFVAVPSVWQVWAGFAALRVLRFARAAA